MLPTDFGGPKVRVHYSYRHGDHGAGTQLFEGAHLTVGKLPLVIRAFVVSQANVAIMRVFVGQIMKYALRIILGFGSNGPP